jgi:hypothetical protein
MTSQIEKIKKLSNNEKQIVEILADDYEYIEKIDAIKYIKNLYGYYFSIREIINAYNAIEKYHY